MQKKWVINESGDNALIRQLMEALSIDEILAKLLVQRGITTYDEAKDWFRPSFTQLHNPFLMQDMDKAVERLIRAINQNEKILIYGDYDVDGTTAVSLFWLFLSKYSNKLDYYIPDRYKEGYGVSKMGIDFAIEHSFSVIITLDCGIKALSQINYASSNGIDVIVCDHHNQGEELPNAYAILNPKRNDCLYPFKDLSGCGVGFKFLQAYSEKQNIQIEELHQYIDIVAVSIASDIVKIVGENRVLVYYGIKKILENPSLGIDAIKRIAQIDGNSLTVSDIVFKIGPRINAAGRIGSGRLAVELLTCQDSSLVMDIVKEVNDNNEFRKDLDKSMTAEALIQIANETSQESKTTNVVFSSEWHKGVVGIVASRITEVYYRPTIVLTESNGKITGSARSVDGFDLYSALEKCADLLENFGGHKYAAGLTMKKENFEQFKLRFEDVVSSFIHADMLIPKIKIDSELSIETISPKFYRILKQFEPYGPGNMTPVFVTNEIQGDDTIRQIGADGSHLKMFVKSKKTNNVLDAIGFGFGSNAAELKKSKFDICYTIEENEFRGETKLQLRIRDIRK
jgi:single-stranded-DNA-specific exonuclease